LSAICGLFLMEHEGIHIEHGMKLMEGLNRYPSDDIHTWHSERLFLGCHAQWITPESVGERLPRYNKDQQLAITADAIIDNRGELFDKLQIESAFRKTMTDSDLILLAYLKWGEDAPKHLIGDFAFMIWDDRKKTLFGARDFSGSRTLYYYHDTKRFAFCTTIQPLFNLPDVPKGINELWFAEFLAIPSMVDSADPSSTAYHRVEQIPPSHSITVCDGKVRIARYCKIVSEERLKLKTNEEYIEAFQEVFQEAVTARLRTYGEVGAQLSGGMDSGAVVSFAANALRNGPKRLQTFSFFPGDNFVDWTPNSYAADERPYINATVNYIGNISDHYFNFEGSNPLSDLDDSLALLEMPYKFFENLFWLKGMYEKASDQGVKVLLSGARGNYSISWGSWSMNIDYYAALLKGLKWLRLNQELTYYCQNYQTGKSVILPIVLRRAFPFLNPRTSVRTPIVNQNQLIHSSFAQRTNVYAKLREYGADPTGGASQKPNDSRKQHFEQLFSWNKSGMANTKLSLRYSLWDRDPTNDLRVIRFCMALPEEQYVLGGLQRSLIRRATENMLPEKVRLNQQVRGIQVADVINRMAPSWNSFMAELNQLVQNPRMNEMLNIDAIKRAIQKLKHNPDPELVFDDEFRMLTRSLTVYRFINKMDERR